MLFPAASAAFFADVQQDTGGNHPGGANRRQTYAGVQLTVVAPRPCGGPKAITSDAPNRHEYSTSNQRNNGDAKPPLRALHTPFHLLQRVSVDCPCRARHGVNTNSVELEL
jgi:hypothetical protein